MSSDSIAALKGRILRLQAKLYALQLENSELRIRLLELESGD